MFTKICQMSQDKLKNFVAKELEKTHDNVIVADGFVYAQGTFPVLLVAHLDTVHTQLPQSIIYNKKKGQLSSPQGIGGDDRCGVYMILEIIKEYNCSVLFCEEEESGAIGADKFTKSKLAKNLEFNYIIELDRRGKNDAVFYDCDNKDFEEFITKDYYKTAWGTFSDISVIAPELKCAAVNLSCGYYNAHTKEEYVVLAEMEESINRVCKILERTTDDDKFEYIEVVYDNNASLWGLDDDWHFNNYTEKYYLIMWYDKEHDSDEWKEVCAHSREEAIGKFLIDHPTLSYDDIDVYDLENYS